MAADTVKSPSTGGDLRPARATPWQRRVPALLRKTFGLRRLRDGQEAVITNVMEGQPTLAIMPTGAGKSLCYQLPALLLPEATLVVSPLIALMKDQCDKLRELGVAAYEANSAVPAEVLAAAEAAIAVAGPKVIFTTPERLADPPFLKLLSTHPVSLMVIDEAHCISQWGHDFRPAFLELGAAFARLGKPRLLALTATATEAVVEDIARQMGVGRFAVVSTGMYRPNLRFAVVQVTNEVDKLARVVELVSSTSASGLVYAATVKAAEQVHAALVEAGISAALYHGRIGAAARRQTQEAFMAGRLRVMVATNAFGLGIDKTDTRFVIHYQMPAGLDAYYQEAGRAGRDGAAAECTLLFLHADKAVQQFFMAGRYPSAEDLADLYAALQRGRADGQAWTLDLLQQSLGRPKGKLQVALRLLRHQRVARQSPNGDLALTRTGLSAAALEQLLEGYRAKRDSDRAMLERMIFYGQTGRCRWKVLLDHFGEGTGFEACGGCDNCRRIAEQPMTVAEQASEPARSTSPVPALFAPGDKVRVRRYGVGRVEGVDAEGVTVRFGEGVTRLFLADFVRPVPARSRSAKELPSTACEPA